MDPFPLFFIVPDKKTQFFYHLYIIFIFIYNTNFQSHADLNFRFSLSSSILKTIMIGYKECISKRKGERMSTFSRPVISAFGGKHKIVIKCHA